MTLGDDRESIGDKSGTIRTRNETPELEITYSELEMGCFFLVPKVLLGNGKDLLFFGYERGLDPKGTP